MEEIKEELQKIILEELKKCNERKIVPSKKILNTINILIDITNYF